MKFAKYHQLWSVPPTLAHDITHCNVASRLGLRTMLEGAPDAYLLHFRTRVPGLNVARLIQGKI